MTARLPASTGSSSGVPAGVCLLIFCAACHGREGGDLSTVTGKLLFSSPDQAAELTLPDAGVVEIAFGAVSVGSFKSLTLDLESIDAAVALGPLTVIQSDAEFGLPLVPGTEVEATPTQIPVSFAPSSTGSKSAQYRLAVYTPATDTVVFELSGIGVANALSVMPNPVNFGKVVAYGAQEVSLTISNGSPLGETLALSPLQGTGAASFSLEAPSTTALAPDGGSATVNVTFEPLQLGGASASFTASAGPGILPVTVDLGGIGVATP